MAAKDINIRLGLIFDEKSLGAIERRLRLAGTRLSAIGDSLTTSLSIPMLAIGGAAVKAAGDIESLTLALKSQLGSSEAAASELNALTEAAKNPGLGLEQAVRGSVRLQGVGFAADEARGVLVELGNAIASTGGTAEDLDRVTKQFTQMTSKGRVLQEDLSVISESMPGVAGLMQKAFGTSSAEAIRNMGISGKDFVLAITQAAKELPRVEGGIKNSIGNALDSLKQGAAKFGVALNNAFNITGNLEALGAFLVRIADGFANLNPAVQDLIVYMAGVAVAIGPVIKIMGSLKLIGAQVASSVLSMVGTGRAISAWASSVATAFNALNVATRAFILIGAVVAITQIAAALGVFNRQLTNAEKAQAALNSVEVEAKKNIAGEKAEVDKLIGVINSEVASREAKERALNNLKAISPEYFGQLKTENGIVNGLTASYDKYVAALLNSARAEAAKGKLVEIERELLDIEDQRVEKVKEAASIGAAFLGNQAAGLKRESENYNAQIGELTAKRDALTKLLVTSESVAPQLDKQAAATTKASGATKELSASAKAYNEVLSDIANERSRQDLLGAKDVVEEAQVIESGLKKLLDAGFKPTSAAVQNLKSQLGALFSAQKLPEIAQLPTLPTPTSVQSEAPGPLGPNVVDTSGIERYLSFAERLGEINKTFQESQNGFNEAFAATAKLVSEQGTVMQQVMFGVADAVSQAASSGASSFSELAGAAVVAAAKVVRAWIQQGVAAAVAKALSSLPFPANLAAGALAGGLAAGAFTKAINSIGVPKFARGTNFASGGLSLVGEQGPELMNVPRGAQILSNRRTNNMLSGMGGSMNISGEFRVKGTDLVFVLEQEQAKQRRRR